MDKKFMYKAIELGLEAAKNGEIPVGAVVVRNGEIIGAGKNDREQTSSALGHAEIRAIEAASKKLNSWRLDDCELYVTLEPCVMCAGAIINSRIKSVIFGAYDFSAGACGSAQNVFGANKNIEIYSGICESQCTEMLQNFFKDLRNQG